MKKILNKQSGVAILFAILLVSIVLTVGLTLLNITLRQLLLSSLARESQFAFYSSDSARNCARYLDSLDNSPFGHFALSGGNLEFVPPSAPISSNACGEGVPVNNGVCVVGVNDSCVSTFTVKFTDPVGKDTCADVVVTKYTDPNPPSGAEEAYETLGKTKIEVRGYNNYDTTGLSSGCFLPGDRTVERASTMIY